MIKKRKERKDRLCCVGNIEGKQCELGGQNICQILFKKKIHSMREKSLSGIA